MLLTLNIGRPFTKNTLARARTYIYGINNILEENVGGGEANGNHVNRW